MGSLGKALCWAQELEISFSSKWYLRDSIQGVDNFKFRMSLFLIFGCGVSELQQLKNYSHWDRRVVVGTRIIT